MYAKTVDAWFRDNIATGEIAGHTPAYNHAFKAKADLTAQLEAASEAAVASGKTSADVAAIVSVWYQQQLTTGEIARHQPACDQAEAAKADLIARLKAAATTPTPASPPAKAKK